MHKIITTDNCARNLATRRVKQVPLEDRLDIPLASCLDNSCVESSASDRSCVFVQLYRQYYAIALQMVYKFEKNCCYADDIVQDVFIQILQRSDSLPPIESFKNYLFVLVRNRYQKFHQKQRNIISDQSDFDSLVDHTYFADDRVRHSMTSSLIENAIRALPQKRQQVFRMSRQLGMKHEQIADTLGIHKITVAQYIMKSINSLQVTLHWQCA